MFKHLCGLAIAAALMVSGLSSCTQSLGQPGVAATPAEQLAQAQKAVDDACYFAKANKASVDLFFASGRVDATGQQAYQTAALEIAAACASPAPADWQQVVSKVTAAGVQLALLLLPPAKS